MQEWGNFPLERKRLFERIQHTGANGFILLSGNVHFAELSRTDEGPYPIYEFTSSGMTHMSNVYPKIPNHYRVAGPFVEPNFGSLEIDWGGKPGPTINISALGVDGNVGFSYSVPLSEHK